MHRFDALSLSHSNRTQFQFLREKALALEVNVTTFFSLQP